MFKLAESCLAKYLTTLIINLFFIWVNVYSQLQLKLNQIKHLLSINFIYLSNWHIETKYKYKNI
jgi:hypothetical protein